MSARGDDRGFTIVELMVAMGLSVLVLVVAGSLLTSLSRTQRQVSTSTTVTSVGQVVTSSLTKAVRNSSAVQLTAPVAGDQLVRARTAGNAASLTWQCEAWYFQASSQTLRYTSSSAAVASPSTTDLKSWTLLASGVAPVTGAAIFGLNTSSFTLTYGFKVSDASSSQSFQSAVSSRTQVAGSSPCF